MILEALVTTTDATGACHLAPMGPRIEGDWSRFVLRPFPTSQTFQNLQRHGEGVLHVTDDVLLLAQAAIGQAPPVETFPAKSVRGFVLANACRYFEFVLRRIDTTGERMHLEAEVLASGTLRDFFGLNRAKHAVLEAAILATRVHLLPKAEILAQYDSLRILVEKTGGPSEHTAFEILQKYVSERKG